MTIFDDMRSERITAAMKAVTACDMRFEEALAVVQALMDGNPANVRHPAIWAWVTEHAERVAVVYNPKG